MGSVWQTVINNVAGLLLLYWKTLRNENDPLFFFADMPDIGFRDKLIYTNCANSCATCISF